MGAKGQLVGPMNPSLLHMPSTLVSSWKQFVTCMETFYWSSCEPSFLTTLKTCYIADMRMMHTHITLPWGTKGLPKSPAEALERVLHINLIPMPTGAQLSTRASTMSSIQMVQILWIMMQQAFFSTWCLHTYCIRLLLRRGNTTNTPSAYH